MHESVHIAVLHGWEHRDNLFSALTRDISAEVHIRDSDWRGKSPAEIQRVVAERFQSAFSAMADRIVQKRLPFDEASFREATSAVMEAFLETDQEPASSSGEAEVHQRLRAYLDERQRLAAIGIESPELRQRVGFSLEPDPDVEGRVVVRQRDQD